MIELQVGDIITKNLAGNFTATVTKIDEEGIHTLANINGHIPEIPEFIWKGPYFKLANVCLNFENYDTTSSNHS